MAVSITVRNVPDEVRDALAARAAGQGRSLQEHLLRELSRLATTPTADDVVRRARARVAATGTSVTAETILAARDADRR
jgi:plasmid stability protein